MHYSSDLIIEIIVEGMDIPDSDRWHGSSAHALRTIANDCHVTALMRTLKDTKDEGTLL